MGEWYRNRISLAFELKDTSVPYFYAMDAACMP